jgi:eukaryotic-like serine/threonine-protein kinase
MALSISQMARMSQLLEESLSLDKAARRAWLESLPPEHCDLADALQQSLLPEAAHAAHLEALMGLPQLAAAADASQVPHAIGLQSGARLGPYQLLRLLGAGGMAEVWLARRADGAFKREVALKLPRLAQAPAGLAARFARERDILATLEHPHIARLYDAGVDPQGLPYLSMEYVQGAPLTQWCDAHQLEIADRLGLFLQVLEAVQYAHDKQVIHRDLKPSNILVTESGQVRLLDFGVAKLLAEETGGSAQLTGLYGRALTPDYASPELLRGDALDFRTDIYSLGVLLYELLTGKRPYQLRTAAAMGLLDRAAGGLQPSRPSTLQRTVRADLDAITLKALAQDPRHRYDSAAALAADLRRYLACQPVTAQPGRLIYRVRKLVSRNPGTVALSVAVFLIAVPAIGYWRTTSVHVSPNPTVAPANQNASPRQPFSPPPHSIAVLPFVNMSSDRNQEYFSDGLTEELLNSLAAIDQLHVAARTSSFYFKGKEADLGTIARQLNVAAVLEGSVRRSQRTIRVNAELIDAVTGFHLWSRSYDHSLGDVLKLQSEIAAEVASALKLTLLGDVGSKIELGGTHNPAAFDAYLRATKADVATNGQKDARRAIAQYTAAIRLDPNYALAFASRSIAYAHDSASYASDPKVARDNFVRARDDARRALALAPELAEGHLALGYYLQWGGLDFSQADLEYQRAATRAPGNTRILELSGSFANLMGHIDVGLDALRRAVSLDPLNRFSYFQLGDALLIDRRYQESITVLTEAIRLDPDYADAYFDRGMAYYNLGEYERARSSCEAKHSPNLDWCLALIFEKLGRHADAQAQLARVHASLGAAAAYQYTDTYAQWGDKGRALDWLETAMRLRDPGLANVKLDPLIDPLRQEPRFQVIERALKFPD